MKFAALVASCIVICLVAEPVLAGGGPKETSETRTMCGSGPFNGPYIGASAGYVHAHAEQLALNNGAALSDNDGSASLGGLAGYNLQCGRGLLGIESDINWVDSGPSGTLAGQTLSTSYDYYGTTRGRIGLVHENLLIYFTGGLAYAHLDHKFEAPMFNFSQSNDNLKWGYTVGGGIELSRGHWSLRAELLWVDLKDTTIDYVAQCFGFVCRSTVRWDDEFLVGRVGLTFKLQRDEPRIEPLK